MSNPTELPDLLPCPFCGEAANIKIEDGWLELRVLHQPSCLLDGDGAEMRYLNENWAGERMVAKWNRRAQPEGEAPQAETLTPLDYRAQGREEVLAIILGQSAEDPLSEYTGWRKSGAPDDEGGAYWKQDELRALLNIGDRKHDAYDRAEGAYWEALGEKEEAKRGMLFAQQAPFYKPLHDFLSKHEAWDLMGDLKRAQPAAQQAAAPGALYSYMGESGRYELIGQAFGAGKCKLAEPLAVYRDAATGKLYFRDPADFDARMVKIEGRDAQQATATGALAAWFDAEQKRLDAVTAYNAVVLVAEREIWPGRDVNPEFQAMSAAQNAEFHARGALFASRTSAPGTPEAPKKPAHGHRDDYYLLANGRRLGLEPISRVRSMPNWVLAMELFATGSTSAHQLCRDAGVDPDSTTTQRAAQLDCGQEGSESND